MKIQYFALLKDQRGLDKETVDSEANTPESLYAELVAMHGFTLPQSALKVAVNDDFSSWGQALKEGDNVVFIPPVAGG
nr:MoaD/ThiS family protein [Pelagicoccus albus]